MKFFGFIIRGALYSRENHVGGTLIRGNFIPGGKACVSLEFVVFKKELKRLALSDLRELQETSQLKNTLRFKSQLTGPILPTGLTGPSGQTGTSGQTGQTGPTGLTWH